MRAVRVHTDNGIEDGSYEERPKELMWLKLENTDELSSFALTIFEDIKHLSERVSDTFFIFTERELSGHWLNWKDERFSFCKEEHLDYNNNKKQEILQTEEDLTYPGWRN